MQGQNIRIRLKAFDHRILDGAVAAAFCNAVMRHLQNPAVLLLPENLG